MGRLFVRVCVFVCVRVSVCTCVCVFACACVRIFWFVSVCVLCVCLAGRQRPAVCLFVGQFMSRRSHDCIHSNRNSRSPYFSLFPALAPALSSAHEC